MNLVRLVNFSPIGPSASTTSTVRASTCGRGLTVEETLRWKHETSRLQTELEEGA